MKSIQDVSYKTLFTILFFSLAGIIFFLRIGKPANKVSAAWWDEMWHYRKAISIENTSGSNLTDFQVSISIGTSQLITEDKMQTDCDDIRITDINGNVLPHWIEENNPGCNQITDTKIWIKASSLPTSGATVYIYYGNSSANNNENGNNVFDFFDNFDNYSNWIGDTSNFTTATDGTRSVLKVNGSAAPGEIYKSLNTTNNYIVEIAIKDSSEASNSPHPGLIFASNGTDANYNGFYLRSQGNQLVGANNGSFGSPSENIDIDNNWHTYKTTIVGGTLVSLIFDNSTQITGFNNWNITTSHSHIGLWSHSSEADGFFDNLFVRKYASVDPTPSLQSEELSPAPIAYWKFDEGVGTTVYDSSSNQNNGYFSGATTWSSENNCINGKCADFNSSQIIFPNKSELNFGTNSFTISTWALFRDYTYPKNTFEIMKNLCNESVGSTGFSIGHVYNPNGANICISDGVNRVDSNISFNSGYKPTDTLNKWTQFTYVFDRTAGKVKVYVNGVKQSSELNISSVTGSINNSNNIVVGDVWGWKMDGLVDELKIYPYARTANQIKQDYNSRGSLSGSSVNLGVRSNTAPSLKSSLVAHYKFDEGNGATVYDSSGNNKNGTLATGSSSPTWNVNGYTNKALSFDGNDSITLANEIVSTSSIRINGITYSAWIKPNNIGSTQKIVGQKPSSGYSDLASGGLDISSGKARMIAYDDGIAYKYATGNTTLTPNKWYLITGIYDPSDQKIKIYVNGIFDGGETSIVTFNRLVPNDYNLIGSHNYASRFFNGLIDEVKIYNRALTPEEIKQDYNQGSAIQFGATNQTIGSTTTSLEYCIPGDTSHCAPPIAEYKMDEGSGTLSIDTSGNNLNAGFSGSPTWVQGKIGKALSFNGSNNLTNNSKIISNGSGLSFGVWIKTSSTDSDTNYAGNAAQNIIGDTNGGSVSFGFGVHGGKVRYTQYTSSWQNITGNISVNDNLWHYISVTHSQSNGNIVIYVDGRQDVTGNIAYNGSNRFDVIARGFAGDHFTGQLDHLRIYNYPRTPAQIAYDYNKGGPVGHWKLDECQGNIAYDWSGTPAGVGNTGVINIGPSGTQNSLGTCAVGTSAAWTNGTTGKINSSIRLDGIDDRITFGNPTSLQVAGTKNFSVAAWIYSTQNKCGREGVDKSYNILCGTETNGGWVLGGRTGSLDFMVSDSTNLQSHRLSFSSQLNTWYHLVGVRNGNTLYLYVDGKLNKTGDITGFVIDDNKNFSIGGNITAWLWPGQIDDVRIYNYALTSEQVKQVYNGGAVNFR